MSNKLVADDVSHRHRQMEFLFQTKADYIRSIKMDIAIFYSININILNNALKNLNSFTSAVYMLIH